MKTAAILLIVVTAHGAFSQSAAGESFIGIHYSGVAYKPAENKVRPFNPGFGATGHLGIGPHFGLEVAWEMNFPEETHPTVDTVVHRFRTGLSSLRFCYTQTHEKWSGQVFAGPGFLLTPDEYLVPEIGLRGSVHVAKHLSLFAAVFGAIHFRNDYQSPGHSPNPEAYYPRVLDARFFFWGNVGIAYRGIVNGKG